ncbi:hypothetical protein CPB86DRAFT_784708 [Serendipita vermifera]|nr:hypothetical protein CPB86DRAFT_784708 [Serendipita vermifera]
MEGRKRKRQEVIDGVILTANLTKDASRAIAVLAPLEASMGMLITLLESIKDVRTNEENWGSLVTNISARIDLIRNTLKDKPYNTTVHDLVFNYSVELDNILVDLNSVSKNYRTWAPVRAKNDAEKIKDAEKRMDEAFKRFESGLQLIIGTGIEALQTGHDGIVQTLVSHSNDHAQSHSRILQLHKQHQSMSNQLENIQAKQKETGSQITESEEINLIKGVNTASLANGGIHRICMKGTRLAILEEARKWMVDNDVPQLLWLNGVAGSGKSTVAKQLSEEWKVKSCLAGRFFFSRDAKETRSPKFFFSTIAQQGLSHLGPAAQTAVALGIRKLRDPVSATLEEQCSEIFEGPLQAIDSNAVLVLDALDECELRTCQQLLRILLPRLSNLPRLKVFLTSRPELHIHEQLQKSTHHFLSFRLDAPENRQDVELYMRHSMHELSLPEGQMEQLIERAGGLFIWAKTVCELLRNIRGDRNSFIRRVLAERIEHMDPIYQIALEQAIRNNDVKESMEAYMNVLKVIVAAYEPLSPDTINQLLGISTGMEIVGDLRIVLECHGADEPVRFLHPTFREFLLKSGVCGQFYVDISLSHHLIAVSCVSIMNRDLKFDVCNLFDDYGNQFSPEERRDICHAKTSFALRYSCVFWANHISDAGVSFTESKELISTVEEFFTVNLIHWLYMIAVVGTFNGATSMIRKLLSTDISENVTKWSIDVERFLRSHWASIQHNPFDVYHHMAFTPLSSIFQQIYAHSSSFPHTVASIGLEEDWPPDVVIQPHKIWAQSLSNCGNWFATGGSSNNRAVFAIWDVKTADGSTTIHPCDRAGCSILLYSFRSTQRHDQPANSMQLRKIMYMECSL